MMKHLLFILIFFLLTFTPAHAQEDLPPYLYYYSDALGGIVIERADGTDSRLMWNGLLIRPPDLLIGPGWSSDGQWLSSTLVALDTYQSSRGGGFVVNADGVRRLDRLDAFRSNLFVNWSPNNQYLFVRGTMDGCVSLTCTINYWVIETETQRVLATTIMRPSLYGPEATPILWSLDEQSVSFYEVEDTGIAARFYVTMYFDGRVIKQPISAEEYNSVVTLSPLYETRYDVLDSPTGRYIGRWNEGVRFENRSNSETVIIPLHSDARGIVLETKWHPSEEWIILGYQRCATDCSDVGGASVMNIDGSIVRELGTCGFSDSCIGWLPESVDLGSLPLGESQSVLPQPVSIDYEVEYLSASASGTEHPYLLSCDETLTYFNQIQDTETGEIVFTLNSEEPCPSDEPYSQPLPFALSPNRSIYAMNRQYRGLTELFDAQTGELLARTNSYSIQLDFSEDGSQLIANSHYATLTWDVQGLIDHFAALRENGWTP